MVSIGKRLKSIWDSLNMRAVRDKVKDITQHFRLDHISNSFITILEENVTPTLFTSSSLNKDFLGKVILGAHMMQSAYELKRKS